MTVLSIFFIVLITAFAVVAFFTEPSQTDKQIHLRLVALDREVLALADLRPLAALLVDDELALGEELGADLDGPEYRDVADTRHRPDGE